MLAYDLVVAETSPSRPDRAAPLLAGWAGPEGPAIDPPTWPRSPRSGQPLRHCVTFWLPEPYRHLFPEAVAVSVFQWHDENGWADPMPHMLLGAVPDQIPARADPFWSALANSRPHPRSVVAIEKATGSMYGLVHLTQAELVGPRQSRPAAAPLFPGEADSDQLPAYAGAGTVWLVPRDDPNAGIAPAQRPIRRDGAGYQEVPDCYDRFAMEHLGGTLMDPDDSAAGDLSPFYFEIISLGGFDFAASRTLAFDLGVDDPLAWDRW
jgi:hypothetical protein